MFQTKQLVERFNHLYLLQALEEIQRRCNKLYLRLKHKVLLLATKRLKLSKLKWLSNLNHNTITSERGQYYATEQYFSSASVNREFGQQHYHNHHDLQFADEKLLNGNFLEDLNDLLSITTAASNGKQITNVAVPTSRAVSIPMLLLPYIVQPLNGLINHHSSQSSNSCGSILSRQTGGKAGRMNHHRQQQQQWHETCQANSSNVCGQSQFITLVPTNASPIIINGQLQQHSQSQAFMTPEQRRNQIQFTSNSQQQQQQQTQAQVQDCRHNWSSSTDGRSCRGSKVGGLRRSLAIRNPLLHYGEVGVKRRL